jgi:hypothetical protein
MKAHGRGDEIIDEEEEISPKVKADIAKANRGSKTDDEVVARLVFRISLFLRSLLSNSADC